MSTSTPQEPVLHDVTVPPAALPGLLTLPPEPAGLVVFAHGSGSSRLSPRNTFVAETLQQGGLATLLFDLLTDEEAGDRRNVFDIPLLADRLAAAVDWCREQPATAGFEIGLFGASTGAAAALVAAARLGETVAAVVSRGGRPDLARAELSRVQVPTMLIVGGDDEQVLELNRRAFDELPCVKELRVVPGATHLFEEPGALESVAQLARDWFLGNLARRGRDDRTEG